jgi:hypothetical protein
MLRPSQASPPLSPLIGRESAMYSRENNRDGDDSAGIIEPFSV